MVLGKGPTKGRISGRRKWWNKGWEGENAIVTVLFLWKGCRKRRANKAGRQHTHCKTHQFHFTSVMIAREEVEVRSWSRASGKELKQRQLRGCSFCATKCRIMLDEVR